MRSRSSSGVRRGARTSGPDWMSSPVAQIRCSDHSGVWTLYCRDRHQRWKLYTRLAPATITRVLDEVDRDPTRIFWG